MTEEELEALMVKVTDGVASPEERERLMRAISDRPELQVELEAHRALKATTDGWVERLSIDAVEDAWTRSPATRVERGLAVGLVAGGTALLIGFGAWELWLDPAAPLWVKLGTSAILAGLCVAGISVLRWKLATAGDDPYTEVIR